MTVEKIQYGNAMRETLENAVTSVNALIDETPETQPARIYFEIENVNEFWSFASTAEGTNFSRAIANFTQDATAPEPILILKNVTTFLFDVFNIHVGDNFPLMFRCCSPNKVFPALSYFQTIIDDTDQNIFYDIYVRKHGVLNTGVNLGIDIYYNPVGEEVVLY